MNIYFAPVAELGREFRAKLTARLLRRDTPARYAQVPWPKLPRVPVSIQVNREGEPSTDYLVTMTSDETLSMLALFTKYGPKTQWFDRAKIYQTVIAQAYEYSEPRMGITRWPTIQQGADSFLFNVIESDGGNQVSTVPALVDVAASVDAVPSVRKVVIVELMDDGQWRVAGYGGSDKDALATLDLQVTTTGTHFALGLDDFGSVFVPRLDVSVGDRVRPTRFRGWVYTVTEAGSLPEVEPVWWPVEGDNSPRLCGTARLQAVRYYRPLAHGPITVEMT